MRGLVLAGVALLTAAAAGFFYWQLKIAEGAYLGPRVVTWLYDLYATRYDGIKEFDPQDESWFLGAPLAQTLANLPNALVLDVATGTGRLPLTLLEQPEFQGHIIALDLSRDMLHQATLNTASYKNRLTLVWQNASKLPFPDGTFDAVTSLEALEFLPNAQETLAEMVRVLRPGGVLLTTNRTGPWARWLPGRTMSRQDFKRLLESLSLEKVHVGPWQVDYDLAWAQKPGLGHHPGPFTLPELLRCPRCAHAPLARRDDAFYCPDCAGHYPVAGDGVLEMNR